MLILGLLLLAATGSFVGLLIADNLSGGPDYTVIVLGNNIAIMSTLAIFCAGLALGLIFCLGLALAAKGASLRRRGALRLREANASTRTAASEHDALAAERGTGHEAAAAPADTGPTGTGPAEQPPATGHRHRRHRHVLGH